MHDLDLVLMCSLTRLHVLLTDFVSRGCFVDRLVSQTMTRMTWFSVDDDVVDDDVLLTDFVHRLVSQSTMTWCLSRR